MKPFRAPDESIGILGATAAARLVAHSADIAFVLDGAGSIQDMAIQPTDLALELEGYGRWFGRQFSDTVVAASRPKVEMMLEDAAKNAASAWRQLVHETTGSREVPILYAAVRLDDGDRTVAIGRDLRAVTALQQRLIDAQMSMERDYAKLRSAETRYRLLFQATAEPVLILDGTTQKVLEANAAAAALLERGGKRALGRPFGELFTAAGRIRAQQAVGELRGGGRADDVALELVDGAEVTLSGVVFRQDAALLMLIRLVPRSDALRRAGPVTVQGSARLADFLQQSPDAFVVADTAGRVVAANPAFAELTQMPDAAAVSGSPLEKWFGRPGVDLDLAMMNLRQHGALRLFSTYLRGSQGGHVDVEVSAVALGHGKDASFGFSIRDTGRRIAAAARPSQELPHSAEQLTELIGRVPLKDLVRETTDVIEKLCIEAALELTGDNRASAAEVLGLSRQSLYVKLRRFGLAEAGVEDDVP